MDAQIPTDPLTTTNVEAPRERREGDITPRDLLNLLRADTTIVLLLVVFGGWLRAWLVTGLVFPLGGGGLLYEMARALIANDLLLPAYFEYNGLFVPFVHPPLGLYLASLFSTWTDTSLLVVFRWYPAWVSTLQIPAFYLLARAMLRTKPLAALATGVFALTPALVTWTISGAAVAHGTAMLFGLLAIWAVYRLAVDRAERYIVPAGVLAGLAALSHAETGVFVLLSGVLVVVMFGGLRTALHALLAALAAFAVAFVWLGPMVWIHGLGPLLAAAPAAKLFQWTAHDLFASGALYTGEALLPIITVMATLGAFVALAKRSPFLPLWWVLALLLGAQDVVVVAVIPAAMLVAVAFGYLLVPLLGATSREQFADGITYISYYAKRNWVLWANQRLYVLPILASLLVIALYGGIGALRGINITLANPAHTVSESDYGAMSWSAKYPRGRALKVAKDVPDQIPPRPLYVVLTGASSPSNDPTNGWFPTITRDASLTSLGGSGFAGRLGRARADYAAFQACINADINCLYAREAELLGVDVEAVINREARPLFTHVYFSKSATGALLQAMIESDDFDRIYLRGGVHIYERDVDAAQVIQMNEALPSPESLSQPTGDS